MLTRDDILMGRDKLFPLTDEMEGNLSKLLAALHLLQPVCPEELIVTSGYRPPSINATIPGAAKKSNHMVCLACDFHDPTGAVGKWCAANLEVLEAVGLWLEHPLSTPGWCHLQAAAPRSGHRMFIP